MSLCVVRWLVLCVCSVLIVCFILWFLCRSSQSGPGLLWVDEFECRQLNQLFAPDRCLCSAALGSFLLPDSSTKCDNKLPEDCRSAVSALQMSPFTLSPQPSSLFIKCSSLYIFFFTALLLKCATDKPAFWTCLHFIHPFYDYNHFCVFLFQPPIIFGMVSFNIECISWNMLVISTCSVDLRVWLRSLSFNVRLSFCNNELLVLFTFSNVFKKVRQFVWSDVFKATGVVSSKCGVRWRLTELLLN